MRATLTVVILALFASSCWGHRRSHVKPDRVPTHQYGAWASISTDYDDTINGELLAADQRVVIMLHGTTVTCVPHDEVRTIRVSKYDGTYGGNWLYVVGAAATPFLHGVLFIISAPVWFAGGAFGMIASTLGETLMMSGNTINWDKVSLWARYPGGAPDSLRPYCDESD